jgi:hypothetical protein
MLNLREKAVPEEDTTIRISREEKLALDTARNAWERQSGRRISAGEFVRLLAERYLTEVSSRPPADTGAGTPGLVAAQEIRPAEAQAVAPGAQVFLVNCTRCGGQIAWRTDWGLDGTCPYCGILLRLMV